MLAARGAARALIDSLNRAYRVRERGARSQKLVVTFAMAAGTLVGICMMLVVVVALPALFAMFELRATGRVVQWLRWPALMCVVFVRARPAVSLRAVAAAARDGAATCGRAR